LSEYLKFQGKLYEKDLEAKQLKLRMGALVSGLRDLLDPTEPVESLDTEQIADQALLLRSHAIELGAVTEEIANIKKLMGK
jgi:hypothetical protein